MAPPSPYRAPMKKLLVLLSLLLSTQLFAQAGTTEIGASAVYSIFESGDLGDIDFDVSIDGKTGYGLTLNHFWTDRFSTELSAYSLSGDLSVTGTGFVTEDVGEVDLTVLAGIVQYHFLRGSRLDPYVGAGVAHVSGEFDPFEAGEATDDFESEIGLLTNAGLAVNLTPHLSVAGDVKYVPYGARSAEFEDAETVNLDPMFFSLGVRLRF